MRSLSLRRRRNQILSMLTLAAAIFAAFTVAPAAAGTDSHGTPAVW